MKGLNEKIKEFRRNKGLTLEQLAQKVGSSKSYMWQLENDPKIKPSIQLIAKIADVLDVSVDFLSDPTQETLESDQKAMVFYRGFKELDDASKQMIMDQMEHLKKIQKGKK